jgi:hypothetical protein
METKHMIVIKKLILFPSSYAACLSEEMLRGACCCSRLKWSDGVQLLRKKKDTREM